MNENLKNVNEVKEILIKRKNNGLVLTLCLMSLPILSLISTIEDILSIYDEHIILGNVLTVFLVVLTFLVVYLIYKNYRKNKIENKKILETIKNLEKGIKNVD